MDWLFSIGASSLYGHFFLGIDLEYNRGNIFINEVYVKRELVGVTGSHLFSSSHFKRVEKELDEIQLILD